MTRAVRLPRLDDAPLPAPMPLPEPAPDPVLDVARLCARLSEDVTQLCAALRAEALGAVEAIVMALAPDLEDAALRAAIDALGDDPRAREGLVLAGPPAVLERLQPLLEGRGWRLEPDPARGPASFEAKFAEGGVAIDPGAVVAAIRAALAAAAKDLA